MLSRRAFLGTAAAVSAVALRGAKAPGLKIGVMDTVFRMAGKPESVALAKRLGLTAVQVTLGRAADGKTLPLEDPAIQNARVAASQEHGIPLASSYPTVLHPDCPQDNPHAPTWALQG